MPIWEASKTFLTGCISWSKGRKWRRFYANKDLLDITSPTKNWSAAEMIQALPGSLYCWHMSERSTIYLQSNSYVYKLITDTRVSQFFFSTIKKMLNRTIWSWNLGYIIHISICIRINPWYCVSSFKCSNLNCLHVYSSRANLWHKKIALGINVVDETIPQSLTPENCPYC